MEIGEPGAVAFPHRPLHAIARDIDAHAQFLRMTLRIGGEKMPMAGTHLPDKHARGRSNAVQLTSDNLSALAHQRTVMFGANVVFHGVNLTRGRSPARFDADHQNTDIRRIDAADPTRLSQGHGPKFREFEGAFFS